MNDLSVKVKTKYRYNRPFVTSEDLHHAFVSLTGLLITLAFIDSFCGFHPVTLLPI